MEQNMLRFVAGFIDGDGCISLNTPSAHDPSPTPTIQIRQSKTEGVPEELELIRDHFGGTLHVKEPEKESHRPNWCLSICAKTDVARLLESIRDYILIKKRQVELALEYISKGKEDHYDYYHLLREAKQDYSNVVICSDKITAPYAAGLFAADGSVELYQTDGYYRLSSKITKKMCRPVLEAIRQWMGCGCLRVKDVKFTANQSMVFFTRILPYLRGPKLEQIHLAMKFQQSKPRSKQKRTEKQLQEAENIAQHIKRLKRE